MEAVMEVLKSGEKGVDYNGTEWEVKAQGSLEEMLKLIPQQNLQEDYKNTAEIGNADPAAGFYFVECTKDNESVPVEAGTPGIFPVDYDTKFYWGLEKIND